MPALVDRLTQQLAARGVDNAKGTAIALLRERGHLDANGNLTAEGYRRQEMGAAGRAKDRAAKLSGRRPDEYVYDKKTNRATLRKR